MRTRNARFRVEWILRTRMAVCGRRLRCRWHERIWVPAEPPLCCVNASLPFDVVSAHGCDSATASTGAERGSSSKSLVLMSRSARGGDSNGGWIASRSEQRQQLQVPQLSDVAEPLVEVCPIVVGSVLFFLACMESRHAIHSKSGGQRPPG